MSTMYGGFIGGLYVFHILYIYHLFVSYSDSLINTWANHPVPVEAVPHRMLRPAGAVHPRVGHVAECGAEQ